jgi:hypothetical protein
MTTNRTFDHRRLIVYTLAWIALLPTAFWSYLAAGSQIWQTDSARHSFSNWPLSLVFLGLFISRSMQPSDFTLRSLTTVSQTASWLFVPFFLCIGIARLTEDCVQLFFSSPSTQSMLAVSSGGALLLLAYLAWILCYPIGSPSNQFGQSLYKGTYVFLFALGLALACFTFRMLVVRLPSSTLSPEAQMTSFLHEFQRLGVLLILLLFLRTFLPPTLLALAQIMRSNVICPLAPRTGSYDTRIS